MTTTSDPRPADPHVDADVLCVGRGLLLNDGSDLPSIVITSANGSAGVDDPLPAGLLPGPASVLPTLDAWIVDVSLRFERVTVVSPTDVLCSAPLVTVPPGWMAEVAARGILAVVVLPGSVDTAVRRIPVPGRATRPGAVLSARIPVCLSD